jgi:glycerol-3-phosphate acyltransferase PlsX
MQEIFRDAFQFNLKSKLGYLLARSSLKRVLLRMDYAEYGGAPLLGVGGIAIVAHGGSNSKAIMNAIRVAHETAQRDVNGQSVKEVAELGSLPEEGEGRRKKRHLWTHLLERFGTRKENPGGGRA